MTGAVKGLWMSPGARISIVVLFALMLALAGANLFFTRSQVAQLRTQQLAACGMSGDIGSIPIPGKPAPSRLAISLVADSRSQWRTLHCPGTLPVPPGFARWARHYHLPSN